MVSSMAASRLYSTLPHRTHIAYRRFANTYHGRYWYSGAQAPACCSAVCCGALMCSSCFLRSYFKDEMQRAALDKLNQKRKWYQQQLEAERMMARSMSKAKQVWLRATAMPDQLAGWFARPGPRKGSPTVPCAQGWHSSRRQRLAVSNCKAYAAHGYTC